MQSDFTFVDLFAGIGGMRLAAEANGGKCVFSSEIDKFCQKTYQTNFHEVPMGDITLINQNEIPNMDLLIAGFPCQPFSIAGCKKGFEDETKGTLFFDICRIIKAKQPKAILLENVKNLKSHDKGNTFKVLKDSLQELVYNIFDEVLDAQYYNIPQRRERIYIVGFKNKNIVNFSFPEKLNSIPLPLKNILQEKVEDKYTIPDKTWNRFKDYKKYQEQKGNGFGYKLMDMEKPSATLTAHYAKDPDTILIPQEDKNPRKLTPRECARLQGFPDSFIIPVSNTQAYKQFGNSVAIPVVSLIIKEIKEKLNAI